MEMQVWSISKDDLKDDLKDDCDLSCPEKMIEKMIATWRAPKKMIWGSGFTPKGSGSVRAVCREPVEACLAHVA